MRPESDELTQAPQPGETRLDGDERTGLVAKRHVSTTMLTADDLDRFDDLSLQAKRLYHLCELVFLDLGGQHGDAETEDRAVSALHVLSEQLEGFTAQMETTAKALRGRASMMKETRP